MHKPIVMLTLAVLLVAGLAANARAQLTACEQAEPINRSPVANDDFATWFSGAIAVDVLANDGDPDGDPITIQSVTNVSGGNAAVSGNLIVFTPVGGATSGRFTYTIGDGHGSTSSATVYISLDSDAVSMLPAAVDDDANVTAAGAAVTISVLANDLRNANATLTITSVSPVTPQGNGHTTLSGTQIIYTPDTVGDATFTYTIIDNAQPWAPSTATVHIHGPNSSGVPIIKNCLDGVCTFTAVAPMTGPIVNYAWRWGDNTPGQPFLGSDKVNHQYANSGTYTVTVTVNYADGSSKNGSLQFDVTFSAHATWDLNVSGLGVSIERIRGLDSFPAGTTAAANWSANPDDCTFPNQGCGDTWIDSGSCDFTECRIAGGLYSHSGTYNVRLKFHRVTYPGGVEEIFKEYPIVVQAIDAEPVVLFRASRPDPNVRRFVFDSEQYVDVTDDGPFPLVYQWDFGDGTHMTEPGDRSHLYNALGTYNVTLTVTDGEGKSGSYTLPIVVSNAPPVPRVTVNCKGLDCELGGETSFDDGGNIVSWQWSFGDGTTDSGQRVTHHYTAGGCYTATLTVTDAEGLSTTGTQSVVAGPALVAANTKVVVDAHVQSYYGNVNGVSNWYTTNGNLNGILEPGETVVVEPTWPIAPSTQNVPVSSFGVYPWGNTYGFRDFAMSYDVSSGTSDCWTLGHCYAVFVLPQFAQFRQAHSDIQFNETNLLTGQPTPGSPVTIHVGGSFADVLTPHWAYADVESVLHYGVDSGCDSTHFCPANPVTRGELARWLMKAEHGASYQAPACTAAPFTDVPCSHPMAAWIAQLKAEGLTTGVGGGNYAPDTTATRAETAVFLLRTKLGVSYVPPACHADFGDVACNGTSDYWAAAWISDIKTRGISNGCDLTAFCPNDPLDRAQAARLFAKTFDLRIDKLQCPVVTNGGLDLVPTHVDQPPIVSMTFNPSPAVVGGPSVATLTLGDPPPTAVNVPISIDSTAATVPATVSFGATQSVATFNVTPANITLRTTTHITATYLGTQKSFALDICTPPPAIIAQPTSRIINITESTTLSVTATGGGGPLSYQWYQGAAPGTPVGTGPTLTVTPQVTTTYYVTVSATCGSVTSATATVTVCVPPTISKQPQSISISSGRATTLSVTAAGSGPLTYQWYEGTAGVTTTPVGTNSNSFTTPVLYAAKSYWVKVTSTCNGTVSVNSATATVTPVTQITRVQSAATSTQSLQSITATWPLPTQAGDLLVAAISGGNVTAIGNFTAPAGWVLAKTYDWNNIKTSIYYIANCGANRGPETFSVSLYPDLTLFLAEYTWVTTTSPLDQTQFNGDNFPGTGGVISTGNTAATAQAAEVAISAFSTLAQTSYTAPTNGYTELDDRQIGNQLTTAVYEKILSATGATGHSVTIGGNAQWLATIATFKSAPPQPPPITSLTFSPSPASTGGTSTGTLTLGIAPVAATTVPLSIDNPSAASIPASVAFGVGQTTATFTVTPATVSTRTTTNITATYLGMPKTTQLDICPVAPSITAQPTSRTINAGQSTTLSVNASGTGTLTYQWYQATAPSQTNPVGTNSSSLTVTPSSTASYWVAVSNGCGITASNTATVTVCTPPGIATQPANTSITVGQSAMLTVTANGSGPFSYQWYQATAPSQTNPVGANSSSLTVTPAATAHYWVRVTSTCNGGAVNSNTATVTVGPSNVITRQQAATGTAQSQSSITVNWQRATTAGDLLVAVVSASNNTAIGNFTAPSGWLLAKNYEWNNINAAIYYYPNCPGGRTSETFSVARFPDLTLQLLEYSGIALASPLDKTAFDGDNDTHAGTVSTGTTAVTAQSKELLISATTIYAQTSFTSPTNSFSEVSDLNIGFNLTTATNERIVTVPGTYGHSSTTAGSGQWVGVIATFKSADTTASLSLPERGNGELGLYAALAPRDAERSGVAVEQLQAGARVAQAEPFVRAEGREVVGHVIADRQKEAVAVDRGVDGDRAASVERLDAVPDRVLDQRLEDEPRNR